MTDRQPTKPGRVSLTDEQTNVTKYYTIEMADEPTDVGTPPTKVNLFSDATAAKYPAGTETVDGALSILGDFKNNIADLYVWERFKDVASIVLGSEQSRSSVNGSFTWNYSGNVQIGSDGSVELVAPINTVANGSSAASAITGKYASSSSSPNNIFYVVSANWDSYGMSYTYQNATVQTAKTSFGYVTSFDANAYPPSVSDGYEYSEPWKLAGGTRIDTLLNVTLPEIIAATLTYDLSDSVLNYNVVIIEIRNLVGTSNFWMNVAINNDCTSSHMSAPASTTGYTPASCNAVIYPDSDSMWNGYYSYCAQSSGSTSKTITGITGNVSVSDASKISIKASSSPYSGNAGATLTVRGVKF